jgi:hypothetical protein
MEDIEKLAKAKELLSSINLEGLKHLLEEKVPAKEQILLPAELSVPALIFNEKLTPLESVVKFLKQEKNLSFKKISELIKRDQRNVWHIYSSSIKKYPEKFVIKETKFWIPVSIFSDSRLSALESLVSHLKDKLNLSYHEIAVLLSRNDRTIWTVYSRSRKKNVK